MDMRRYLPILLLVFVALFILPQLFKGGSSNTLSSKERAAMTRDAMLRIDKAQKAQFAAKGEYSANLADLVVADKVLARDLTAPLDVHIDLGTGGKSYVVRVSSDQMSVVRARKGADVVSSTCQQLKRVKCPEPAQPKK